MVKIKVESEERINRITRGSGDEIIGVNQDWGISEVHSILISCQCSNFLKRR